MRHGHQFHQRRAHRGRCHSTCCDSLCCCTVFIRQESQQKMLGTTVEVIPRLRLPRSDTQSRLHVGCKWKWTGGNRARFPRPLIGRLKHYCRTQVLEVKAGLGKDRPYHGTAMGICSCGGGRTQQAPDPWP